VLFVFDENTNACSEKGTSAQSRTFPAKVAPPQLRGRRVGLFSTRTPHRPNPLGLSLVQVVSVDIAKRCILVGGVDLVHATPILDVKPYIPLYDSIPQAASPQWILEGTPNLEVVISDSARAQLNQIALPKSSLYRGEGELLLRALGEVLRLDVRSTHQGRGKPSASDYQLHFDVLRVNFTSLNNQLIVTDLVLDDVKKARYREATKESNDSSSDAASESYAS